MLVIYSYFPPAAGPARKQHKQIYVYIYIYTYELFCLCYKINTKHRAQHFGIVFVRPHVSCPFCVCLYNGRAVRQANDNKYTDPVVISFRFELFVRLVFCFYLIRMNKEIWQNEIVGKSQMIFNTTLAHPNMPIHILNSVIPHPITMTLQHFAMCRRRPQQVCV